MDGVKLTNPFIFNVLDISTGHMKLEDAERLETEAREGCGPVYELHEYGFLVYVGEIYENWPPEEMSKAFTKVLKTAKELGCEYVRFDRDGREYPELESFEW
jgi:hypothetical protein